MADGPGKRYKHKETGKVRSYETLRKQTTDERINAMVEQGYIVETDEMETTEVPPAPPAEAATPTPTPEKKSTAGSSAPSGGSSTPGSSSSVQPTFEEAAGGNTLEARTALNGGNAPETPGPVPPSGTVRQNTPVNPPAPQQGTQLDSSGQQPFKTDFTDFGQKNAMSVPSRTARKVGMPENFVLKGSPLGGLVADKKTTDDKLQAVKDRFQKGALTEDDALLIYASATGRYDRDKALEFQREHNYDANHPEIAGYRDARAKLEADIDANETIPFSNFPIPGAMAALPGSAADPARKKTSILDGNPKAFGEYAQRRIGQLTEQLNNITNRVQAPSTSAGVGGGGTVTGTLPADEAERDRITAELNDLRIAIDVVATTKFAVDGDPVKTAKNYNRYLQPKKFEEQERFEKQGLIVPERDRFQNERLGREILLRKNRMDAEQLQDYVKEAVTGLVKRAEELDEQIAGIDVSSYDQRIEQAKTVDEKNKIINERNTVNERRNALLRERGTVADALESDPKIRQMRALEQQFAKSVVEYATLSDKYPEQRRREITRAIGEAVYADVSPFERMVHIEFTDDRIKKAVDKLGLNYEEIKNLNLRDEEFAGSGILDQIYAGFIRKPAANIESFFNRTTGTGIAQVKRIFGDDAGARREIDQVDIENARKIQDADDETKIASDARIFGTPTKIDLDASSATYLREVRNMEYGKDNNLNWNSVMNVVGDVGGQVLSYAIGAKGVGGVAKTAGMAENAAMRLGTFTSGFIQSYEPNYQTAREFLDDDTSRMMFATIQAAKTAATELILPDYKILDRITGQAAVKASMKKYLDIVADGGVKGLTKTKVKSFVKETLLPILTNTVETSTKENLEEATDVVATSVVNSMFGKERDGNMAKELKETAIITTLGTLPLGLFGGGGNVSRLRKDAYYEAGLNPDWYKHMINRRVDDGLMKRAEADRSIDTINAMDEIIKQLPRRTPAGRVLNEQERVDVAYNRLREWKLKKEKEATTDDVLKEQIDTSIKEVQQERKDIYEPKITANEQTGNADTGPAQQSAGPAESDNAKQDEVQSTGDDGAQSGTGGSDAERRIIEILGNDPELAKSTNPMVRAVRAAATTGDPAAAGSIISTLREQVGNRDQFAATFGEPLTQAVEALGAVKVGRSNAEMTADLDQQKGAAIISSNVKTAIEGGRKKQVVGVDAKGKQNVYEIDYTMDDADAELQRLEGLAERDKLTVEQFDRSYFGQTTATNERPSIVRALESDPKAFVRRIRENLFTENTDNANQEQVTTQVPARDQSGTGQEVRTGNTEGQEAAGEGQKEKVNRFGSVESNLGKGAFDLYSQYQDIVGTPSAQDEMAEYEEGLMEHIRSSYNLPAVDAAKITATVMENVYDDAGIQDNQDNSLQDVIDKAVTNYSKSKAKSNEKEKEGRGLRVRPEEVKPAEQEPAPETSKEPEQDGPAQASSPEIQKRLRKNETDRQKELRKIGQPGKRIRGLYKSTTGSDRDAWQEATIDQREVNGDTVKVDINYGVNKNGGPGGFYGDMSIEQLTKLVNDMFDQRARDTQLLPFEAPAGYEQQADEQQPAAAPVIPEEMQPFARAILPDLTNDESNAYAFRPVIEDMDMRARKAAVRDINEGIDSAGARRLVEVLTQWFGQGFVPFARGGRGNTTTEYAEVPIAEYVSLGAPAGATDEQVADAMTSEAADIINLNGITLENLTNFKSLFNGFPYSEQDYQNVERYLQEQQAAGSQEAEQPGTAGQPEPADQPAGQPQREGAAETQAVDLTANVKDMSAAERQRILDELNASIGDFKQAVRKGYMTSGGINPEAIEKGAKMVALYAKLKIHDLKTIVTDLINRLGADFFADSDNVDAVKGAYAFHRQNNKADRTFMDNEDRVDAFIDNELPTLIGRRTTEPEFPKTVNLGKERKEYTFVGVNSEGKALYEDDNGVRAKDEGSNIFSNEPVAVIPGVGWSKTNRTSDYKTVEELDNEQQQQENRNPAGATSQGLTGADGGTASGLSQTTAGQGGTGNVSGPQGTQVLRPDNANGTEGDIGGFSAGTGVAGNVSDSVNVNTSTRHPGTAPIAPKQEGHNFSIPPDFSHGTTFSPTQKYRDNIAALKLLINLIRKDNETGAITTPTREQQEILFKYVGWGGLKEILYDPERESMWSKTALPFRKYVQEVYALAKELDELGIKGDQGQSVIELMKDSTNNAHYTAIPIIRGIYYAMEKAGFKGGKVLEPSAGIGHFIGAMPHKMMERSNIAAVEKDAVTGNILRRLYPDAKTFIGGFEDSNAPKNYMDLVISNIPFGSDIKIFDSEFSKSNVPAHKMALGSVHNYFFAKSLETAREGGLVAIVTTAGVLDSAENDFMRRHISENAEFVGAIRLPNTAFQVNANTEVVTDVIFLRKFRKGEKPTQKHKFIGTRLAQAKHKNTGEIFEVKYNEYFHDNPQNMLGELAAGGLQREDQFFLLGQSKTEDFETKIREAVDRIIPEKIYTQSSTEATDPTALTRYFVEKSQGARPGNVIVQGDKLVRIVSQSDNQFEVEELAKSWNKGSGAKLVRNYIRLRDALNKLYAAELSDEASESVEQKRAELNEAYENYIANHKNLRHKDNGKLLSLDIDGFNVRALERVGKTGEIEKADILNKRTIKPYKRIDAADNINDAILISLNEFGYVNMDRLTELRNMTAEQVVQEAGTRLYLLPEGGYEIDEQYLSGNVKKKLAEAKLAATVDAQYQRNVEALEKVIPADIKTSDIEVRIGARWVDAKYYSDFATEMFGTRVDVRYGAGSDQYRVQVKGQNSVQLQNWGVKAKGSTTYRLDGADILAAALKLTPPVVTDTIEDPDTGKEKRVVNQELTDIAQQKYNDLREKFIDWIWAETERREVLSRKYNDIFNTTIKRKYDGSLLSFAGYSSWELRQHQKDAVWMIIQNMGGIVDHIVGGGKTLIIVTAAMELKRMGLVKKPLIMGLKANTQDIAKTFREAYPMAKVLSPRTSDFSAKNRKQLLASIANNDWDAVIITHDNYGRMPHSLEVQGAVIQEELDMLDADIAELERELRKNGQDGLTKKQLQGLQKRKMNLITKLRELMDKPKDTELRNFDELGIDKIFVDESQEFKNLEYSTKQRGVAGLGDPKGSQRAFNLLLGVRTMQKLYRSDKGVTFLSGTPISNTLVEMYLLLKYLRPRKLEELNMKTFDSWVSTFGYSFSDVEFAVTGSLGQKNRFRQFVNVPELSILYNEIADIRNDSNLVLPKPKMKGGKPILVDIEQSPEQRRFMDRLIEFVRSKGDQDEVLGLGPLTDKQKKAFGLLATGLSSKAAIDMRLIFRSASDNPTGKIARVADNVLTHYRESDQFKGTQLVFSDMGTPKSGKVVPDLYDYLQEVKGVNEDDLELIFGEGFGEDDKKAPAIKDVREKMKEVLELTDTEIDEILEESKQSQTQFNVYSDLKDKLIARGIPADEIAFIHSYNTNIKKDKLFQDVRDGKIRVLLGSTKKLGTGVNVQDRIVSMHHVDVPWRPADMEQRNGRGIRQGNWLAEQEFGNEVAVYNYATVLTLDAYKYQLLGVKLRYINQVKDTAEGGERIINEEAGDDSELSINEIVAALSGNPDILNRAKYDKKVQALSRQKKNHEQERYDAQSRIDYRVNQIEYRQRNNEVLDMDLNALADRYLVDETGKRYESEEAYWNTLPEDKRAEIMQEFKDDPFPTLWHKLSAIKPAWVIGGVNYEGKGPKEIGAKLIEFAKEYENKKPVGAKEVIGTLYGMPVQIETIQLTTGFGRDIKYQPSARFTIIGAQRSYNSRFSQADEVWAARHLQDAFFEMFKSRKDNDDQIAQMQKDIPVLQKTLETEFPKEKELQEAREELSAIQERLRVASREAPTNNDRDFGEEDETGELEGIDPDEPSTPVTGSTESIDDAIKRAQDDLRNQLGGTMPLGIPLNALPQLTNLAILYFQKGLKTAAQFAKAIGTRLNNVVVQAWNAAKKAVRDYWRESQNMGAISPSMRRFLNPNPPTGGGGGGTPGGNTGNTGNAGNTGQPPGAAPTGAAPIPKTTSLFQLQAERADALKRGLDRLAELQQLFFKASDVDESQIRVTPTILGRAEKLVNVVQDATFGALSRAIGKGVRTAAKAGLESDKEAPQAVVNALNNIIPNLAQNTEDVLRGERFAGETKTRWINDAVKISEYMRNMVDNNRASMDRIDRVLDPEFYKELTVDEFKEALRGDDIDVDNMTVAKLNDRYAEYRKAMHFDDPGYQPPTYDTLTDKEKELHDIIRVTYDMLHDINFGIGKITKETYEANMGVYSARLYKYFEIPKEAQDAMRNNPQKLDESLYRERGDITEWKLLNRLTDPVYGVTKRLYQTMTNKAILDYAQYVVDKQPDAVSKSDKKGYRRLGWGYGALSNKYVRNDIAEDFIGHFYANDLTQKMYDYLKMYDRIPIRQFYKKLFTVYNPGTHLGNMAGNYIFGFLTGINPIRLSSNLKWAIDQAANYSPEYRYLLSEGVLQTDITQAEHKNAIDDLNNALANPDPKWYTLRGMAGGLQKIYSATDDVFKMAAFKSFLEMGYTPKEAVNQVKEGFQNYMRVGKTYDFTSKLPLIGNPFGRFAGDMERIFRKSITQRPLFTLSFLMMWKLMSILLSRIAGEDERQRKIRESRAGMPKIPFFDALGGDIPLAFKVGEDEVNLARFLSPMFVYGSANNEDNFEFFQKLSPFPIETVEYTKNPMGTAAAFIAKNANDPVWAPLVQLATNADFRGAPIYDPKETQYKKALLTKEEKGANAIRFLARQYIPYYTTTDDMFASLTGNKDYYGREREGWQIIVNFIGPKITRFPETRYGEILEQKLNNFGYQFKEEEEAIRALGKQLQEKAIDQDTYIDRMVPHLEEQTRIVQKARDEYNKLKGLAGSTPLIDFDPSISKAKKKKKGGTTPGVIVPQIVSPNIPSP